mmetsp:Transcript_53454/g.119985  ORF Transcript_53454/g.119985 Transcript_53454/m.119985 type:complete len:173 (-) Transcript_53454:137-655(-)
MRTFPGAWVIPGGGVDESDATLASAALRELEEETGLQPCEPPGSPFCIWESCYPTAAHEWEGRRAQGGRTSHHLIVYFVLRVDENASALRLQPDECDCALWVPLDDIAARLAVGASQDGTHGRYKAALPASTHVAARNLAGVYPNELGEGIGRGHLWAIRQLASSSRINSCL